MLASYRYAAESDGTNVDVDAGMDVGPTVGFAYNFAGNLVKLGIAGKAIVRNQLKGVYAHATLPDEAGIASLSKEGWGVGADAGLLITLPSKFLPSVGLAWRDMFGTYFRRSNILNGRATETPDKIPQSVNAAFSVHPWIDRMLRSTIVFEMRHIERVDWPLSKKLHFGIQLEDAQTFYVWAGLNQLYPTAGVALRLRGGNLELGSYATDIGEGETRRSDRRFFIRYTISF